MATIFVFGASIALGSGDPEGGWASRLRKMIDAQAGANTVSKNLVYNLGIPSETTTELITRMEGEIRLRCRPNHTNVAILSVGGNDAAYDLNERKFRVPPERFVENMQHLVKTFRCYCPVVLVQNLTPVIDSISGARAGSTRSKLNQYVDRYNGLIAATCESSGALVLDIHRVFTDKDYKLLLCDDGVHPNGRGHAAISQTVASKLAEYILTSKADTRLAT